MALRLTVELVCDARRAPGCHGTFAARGEALATVVFEVEKEAASAGWAKERTPGNLISEDVCPACRAAAPRILDR
jgi:hypothetical protein